MGLDMYLYKESTFGGIDNDFKEVKVTNSKDKTVGVVKPINKRKFDVTVTQEVAYWRKANAIHKWFCNLDDG